MRPILLALFLVCVVSCQTVALAARRFVVPRVAVAPGTGGVEAAAEPAELAGDLLLATNSSGAFLVEFSKTPFTLATASVTAGRWQIEFGNGKHSWRGPGEPPRRFIWFQLPRLLAGAAAVKPWRFTRPEADSWRLEKTHTGEFLEGGFFP